MSAGERGSPVDVILLAAGASRRMAGRDKLTELVDGRPLIAGLAAAALASAAREVLVTLPSDAPARAGALAALNVRLVQVPEAAEGMCASLRAGVRALRPDAGAVVVMLGDMPEVTSAILDALIEAYRAGAEICRAESGGVPGHPVLFDRRHFPALASLSGDRGARDLLREQAARVRTVAVEGATVDLDTPEAWAAWRAAHPGR